MNPSLKAREDDIQCPNSISKAGMKAEFLLPSAFCSVQAPDKLEDSHPHWGGQSNLLSLHIQMLTAFRNTLTNTCRNNI